METNELAFQSFERNQGLQDAINKLLIHLKLSAKGVDDRLTAAEVSEAREMIIAFLLKLNALVGDLGHDMHALMGIDLRYRSLVKKYMEAKGKKQQFRSVLFRVSPDKMLELLRAEGLGDQKDLIESLTEFRTLMEDHGLKDVRTLMGGL